MARITVVGEYPAFLESVSVPLGGIAAHEVAGLDGDLATLQQVVASAPQLLIVDLRTEGEEMKGWDMLQLARASQALRDVPLLVCFANMPRLRERANQSARVGNVWTLAKPFSAEEVSAIVGRALKGG